MAANNINTTIRISVAMRKRIEKLKKLPQEPAADVVLRALDALEGK